MVDGKTVRCVGNEVDQYGRLIARCSTDEVPDIGARLVVFGLAWAFIKYSTDYSELEAGPRAKKLGIWQSKTPSPWEYRARCWERATKVMPASCPVKGNINAKGEGMTAGSLEMFLDRACGLRLDPEGFEMTSFIRTVPIKWTDVERFDLDSIRRTQIIRIDYAPHYQPQKIGRRLAWLVSR